MMLLCVCLDLIPSISFMTFMKLIESLEQPFMPCGYTMLQTRSSTLFAAEGVSRQGRGLPPGCEWMKFEG